MKSLSLNREYARRHAFVALLMLGMGCWFGYDGFVRYPALSPEALYADCHNGAAAASPEEARRFYAMAIPRQHQFMALCFLAALVVGFRLALAARQRVAFDDDGFSVQGVRRAWSDISHVDRSRWTKKGILRLTVCGRSLTLDAWHHTGVKDFEQTLTAHTKGNTK